MMGKSLDQFLRCHLKSFADSQQSEQSNRAPGLNHLPMTDAEPIRDHVLLGQLPLHPVGPNSMPQRTEEPCIVRWDLSAGTHISSLGVHEQKHHEQKCVLNGTAPVSVIESQM